MCCTNCDGYCCQLRQATNGHARQPTMASIYHPKTISMLQISTFLVCWLFLLFFIFYISFLFLYFLSIDPRCCFAGAKVMAFVTFLLVAGLGLGAGDRFSPQALGVLASSVLVWAFCFIKKRKKPPPSLIIYIRAGLALRFCCALLHYTRSTWHRSRCWISAPIAATNLSGWFLLLGPFFIIIF